MSKQDPNITVIHNDELYAKCSEVREKLYPCIDTYTLLSLKIQQIQSKGYYDGRTQEIITLQNMQRDVMEQIESILNQEP